MQNTFNTNNNCKLWIYYYCWWNICGIICAAYKKHVANMANNRHTHTHNWPSSICAWLQHVVGSRTTHKNDSGRFEHNHFPPSFVFSLHRLRSIHSPRTLLCCTTELHKYHFVMVILFQFYAWKLLSMASKISIDRHIANIILENPANHWMFPQNGKYFGCQWAANFTIRILAK